MNKKIIKEHLYKIHQEERKGKTNYKIILLIVWLATTAFLACWVDLNVFRIEDSLVVPTEKIIINPYIEL